jgi:hypothetical protein
MTLETISPRRALHPGDVAHSREFSEDAYKRAAEPKGIHCPGRWTRRSADRVNLIPWDKLKSFFNQHLAA